MKTPKAQPSRLPRLLSIPHVAEHLGVCTKTVRRLIDAGGLPTTRVGRTIRIAEPDLAAYLARGKQWCPSLSSIGQAFQHLRPE